MSQEPITIDTEYFNSNYNDFSVLKESAEKLLNASENDFNLIKNERWFTRLFDIVTFSKKNEIRLGSQITSMAQAQSLLVEILLRLSENDKRASEFIAESHAKIHKLAEQDILIARRIRQIENVAIYGIPSPKLGISSFNETEKRILSGVVTFISMKFEEASAAQQNYANSLFKNLNIDLLELENINLSLEKIADTNIKKVIFQCALELVFLNSNSFENKELIETVVDLFDFGKKSTNEIVSSVEKEFKIRGQAGIAEKYGTIEMGFLIDEFFFEMDDDLELIETTIEKTELRIENIIQISAGETRAINNKFVRFDGIIECSGKLIFENCDIIYREESKVAQIDLADGSSVDISNCNIECKSSEGGKYLFNSNYSDTVNIEITDSTLNKCFKFIESNSDESKVSLRRCKISESKEFINGVASFEECKIIDPMKYSFNSGYSNKMNFKECFFDLTGSERSIVFHGGFDISFTTFKGSQDKEDNYYSLFGGFGNPISLKNCTFKDIMRLSITGDITDSYFKNCSNIFESDTTVSHCTFDSCKEISSEICGSNIHLSHCTFRNIAIDSSPLFSFSCGEKSSIKKSFFNGIYLRSTTPLINSRWGEKDHLSAIIEECHFKNCYGGIDAKLIETMGLRDKSIGEQAKTFAKKGGAFALLGGPIGIAAAAIGGIRTLYDDDDVKTTTINIIGCTGLETIIDSVPPTISFNEVIETSSGSKIGCSYVDSSTQTP